MALAAPGETGGGCAFSALNHMDFFGRSSAAGTDWK